jgi:hypothetical protein
VTQPAPARTPNRATSTQPERSSRRAARKSPLGWLPWALLAVLGLLLAAVLLVINAVDDDGPDGAAGDSLGQVGSGGSGTDGQDGDGRDAGTEEGTGAGGAGTAALTADGQDLLAASGGSLAERAGQSVTGTARVESVVSDEGFWVGDSATERVFVYLTPEARRSQGESGFRVTAGQTVQLEGVLTGLADAPEAAEGVEAAEGRSQLDSQAAFVSARAVALA